MSSRHPKWIDEYTKSIHRLFRGMDLRTLEPLDCFHFHPLYSDLWQEHLYQAIQRLKNLRLPFNKAVSIFPNPSSVRAMILFMVCHYNNIVKDKVEVDKNKIRETFDFFIKVLKAKNKRDIFCYKENIGHSDKEVRRMLKQIKWQPGTPEASRALGRLYLGASSLVNGLMNDWCTDNGIEVWGPYNTSKYFGPKTMLVIREFPRLKPVDLWPQAKSYKYKNIKICSVYKNVSMRVEFVGCHVVFKGNLADNLEKYAFLVDGKYISNQKKINQISTDLMKYAQVQWQRVQQMDFEALKQKLLAQEFYQLKDFFKLVGMSYNPPQEFKQRVIGKKLLKNRYPLQTEGLPKAKIDHYFGINNLIKLYTSK